MKAARVSGKPVDAAAARAGGSAADTAARRAELARALLTVQQERMALTEAFMRLGIEAESGPVGIEAVLLRLLRLRRAAGVAHELVTL